MKNEALNSLLDKENYDVGFLKKIWKLLSYVRLKIKRGL